MDIDRYPDPEALGEAIAGQIASRLAAAPRTVLGLASGKTPIPVYAALARMHRRGEVSFAQATVFALDEYLGVSASHPDSFSAFFQEHLCSRLDLPAERFFIPDGAAGDPVLECRSYDARILAAGGLDFCLLGVGTNGHLAMNEPAPVLASQTHVEELSDDTRALLPPALSHVRFGITMGMGTIFGASELVLIAVGESKAEIVTRALLPVIDPMLPASCLKLHPRATLAVDAEAGAFLVGAAR